jgi:hypothetical protein
MVRADRTQVLVRLGQLLEITIVSAARTLDGIEREPELPGFGRAVRIVG